MKINDELRIDIISSISDGHLEEIAPKRAEALARVKKKRVIHRSVSAIAACFIAIIPCILLLILGLRGQVPVYNGMTVSNEYPIKTGLADGGATALLTSYTSPEGLTLLKEGASSDRGKREEGMKKHFDLTSAESIYYAKPGEDIYITVKIDNPDDYEILSFTLNGEKYTSYMFEEGSDMSNIVIKVNVGDVEGRVSYTIDAIKYVDGERIKDVRMNGERTVEIGIYNDNQPTASVKDMKIGLSDLSFSAYVNDPEGLIAYTDGETYAVVYGKSDFHKVSIPVGEAVTVSFDGLVRSAEYSYAVVAVFDAYDGRGTTPHILCEGSFNNDPKPVISELEVNADEGRVAYKIVKHNGISTVLSVELVNESGQVVRTVSGGVSMFTEVPPGKHTVRAVYSYNDGENEVKATVESSYFFCSLGEYPVVGNIATPFSNTKPILVNDDGWTTYRIHAAVDFVPSGTDMSVYSVTGNCVVKDIYTHVMYGLTVEVFDRDLGYTYLYQSLAEVSVRVGDSIECGDVIGKMGSTAKGDAAGVEDHLHFVVLDENNAAVDPNFADPED